MRVLLVQQTLNPPGGGNAVAAWMLQALAGHHEIATVTQQPWDAVAVDAFYGTSLAAHTIPQLHPAGLATRVAGLPGRLDRLRMAVVLRHALIHADRFDLLVTAHNYAAFKRPGIQYVHYPAPIRPKPAQLAPLVHAYYRFCDALSGLSWHAAQANRTLVNSAWTKRHLEQFFGVPSEVLYPPVADPGEGLPWEHRTNNFLCIGRFDATKRIETVISIVSRLRPHQSDVTLTIVGSNVEDAYTARLKAIAARYEWVTMREDVTQQELFAIMHRSRYGIHAMEREHFGLAAAEMARAGCVVFAHDSGGLVEVVAGTREVLWDTPEQAVTRILTVIRNEQLQRALSTALRDHASSFSTERFVHQFQRIVTGNTDSENSTD